MKSRLFLLGMLALVLFVSACAPPPELRDPNLLRDESVVSGEPCDAPCWRGITVGETAWRDALAIVEDDPELDPPNVQTDENSTAVVAEFQATGGSPCCQMYSETGEIADLLFLRVAPTTTLGDVIEARGEPSYAIGSPFSDNQAIINLLYPDIPLVVYAFVAGEAEGRLSASSEIIGLLYLKPSDMELLLVTSDLHAWEGYADYAAYRPDGELELTPSVTLTPTSAPE
ncbi:MAG: hypothetical protein IAE80_00405 [Anaerolinea sp.]|nr:hypothetical protein [Anaerolinea sp.]